MTPMPSHKIQQCNTSMAVKMALWVREVHVTCPGVPTVPPVGPVEDFHLQVGAPCRGRTTKKSLPCRGGS